MKILINAIRLSSAGGQRVGINLLKSFDNVIDSNHEILFLCPYEDYSKINLKRIIKVYLPAKLQTTAKWVFGQRWVKKQLTKYNPDVVFNLCNTPSKTTIIQVLLLHWPYATYNEDYIWKNMPITDLLKRKLRFFLIKKNYKYVDHLTVQTYSMQKRSKRNFLKSKEVTVIPSSFDLQNSGQSLQIQNTSPKTFIYLSKYYYHKNHNILIEVAKIIKKKNLDFIIQVTIDENQSVTKNFLKKITDFELNDIIVNVGAIPADQVDSVIEKAFATINPSFLESFGLTYLEAASKNKLVLASDLDFVRETMKDAAIYFNPFDPDSIVDAMIKSLDKTLYAEKVKKGREIIESWPSWDNIATQYLNLLEKIYLNSKTN